MPPTAPEKCCAEENVDIGGRCPIIPPAADCPDQPEIFELPDGADCPPPFDPDLLSESTVTREGLAVLAGILTEPAKDQFCPDGQVPAPQNRVGNEAAIEHPPGVVDIPGCRHLLLRRMRTSTACATICALDERPNIPHVPDRNPGPQFHWRWKSAAFYPCPPRAFGYRDDGWNRRIGFGRTDDLAQAQITGFREWVSRHFIPPCCSPSTGCGFSCTCHKDGERGREFLVEDGHDDSCPSETHQVSGAGRQRWCTGE